MVRIALFAVAFLVVSSAQAQVYKCVDSSGKTIYSQDPCPANTKSGTMSRSGPSAPAAPSPDSTADKAAKESGQKDAEAQRKAEACRNARDRLAQYEIGGRLSRINAQGERYYLEDTQVEQEKVQARADIARACN